MEIRRTWIILTVSLLVATLIGVTAFLLYRNHFKASPEASSEADELSSVEQPSARPPAVDNTPVISEKDTEELRKQSEMITGLTKPEVDKLVTLFQSDAGEIKETEDMELLSKASTNDSLKPEIKNGAQRLLDRVVTITYKTKQEELKNQQSPEAEKAVEGAMALVDKYASEPTKIQIKQPPTKTPESTTLTPQTRGPNITNIPQVAQSQDASKVNKDQTTTDHPTPSTPPKQDQKIANKTKEETKIELDESKQKNTSKESEEGSKVPKADASKGAKIQEPEQPGPIDDKTGESKKLPLSPILPPISIAPLKPIQITASDEKLTLKTTEKPKKGSKFVDSFISMLKKTLTNPDDKFDNDLAIIEEHYEHECDIDYPNKFYFMGGLQPFIKREIDLCINKADLCHDDYLNGLLRMYGLVLLRTFHEAKLYRMIRESERIKCQLTTKLFEALTSQQWKVPIVIDNALREEFKQATLKYSTFQAQYRDGVLCTAGTADPIPIAIAYLSNTDFVQFEDKRCNLNTYFRNKLSDICSNSPDELVSASKWWDAVQKLTGPGQFYVANDLMHVHNAEPGIQDFCLALHIKELDESIMMTMPSKNIQSAIDKFKGKRATVPLATVPFELHTALGSPETVLAYFKAKYDKPQDEILNKQFKDMSLTPKKYVDEIMPEVFTVNSSPNNYFAAPYQRSEHMCTFLLQPSLDLLRAPLSEVKVPLKEPLETTLKDRFMGILFGAAAGDAFGAGYEFMTKGTIDTYLDLKDPKFFDNLHEYEVGQVTHFKGVYTDDTCMALCISAMYIESGTVDCNLLMTKFKAWTTTKYMNFSNTHRDVGSTTSSSLSTGIPSGKLPSNGGVMRQWPNVLFNAFRPVEVVADSAAATSVLTHAHAVARDAARLLAVITYDLLHGVTKEELKSPNYLIRRHPDFWQRRPLAPEVGDIDMFSVLDLLIEEEEGLGCAYLYPYHGGGGHRRGAGLAGPAIRGALEAFFATNSYLEGLVYVVVKGWDSDTTGAIYGQFAGAFYKKSGIPEWMIHQLYASPALQQLGEAIWRRAQDPSASLDDLKIIKKDDGKVQDFKPTELPDDLHGNNENKG